ncbi:DUF211 domain-containing protein [Streptomyces nodosus]|uniref:DUF211 domain-containing protein n=1 Tax=Streptomyces nodosus TaxID=40318 RepID=A0A0B5DGH1_9ACTN|nr:DUF211 domain-containing protein [Streptomyces nodosus]AJE39102.1 hypothetical protein SNOD_02920 [Streptomyces nodosus]MBB4789975.1 hypothetical protein [Streptomyces nodosus]QEV37698.1 hypothetical protein CP978_03315 [Streptomyces nodosus]
MPVRRLVLDVDKTVGEPDLIDLALVIEAVSGVQAVNIAVTEIDIETVGTNVTVEGDAIDVEALNRAIERTGAVVHSVDEVVAGAYTLENTPRSR